MFLRSDAGDQYLVLIQGYFVPSAEGNFGWVERIVICFIEVRPVAFMHS